MSTYTTRREAEQAEAQATSATLKSDRRFLWCWLTISTLLSVAGNVGHAWLTVPTGSAQALAIAWAAAPPTLLMLAVHGLPTLSRMLGSEQSDKLLKFVVWGVVTVTFGWSAFGIFGFTAALGVPSALAVLAPLGIDLSVFGATRGLVLTSPLAARLKVGAPRPTSSAASTAAPPAPRPPSTGAPNTPRPAPSAAPQKGADAPTPAPETLALAEKIVESRAVRQPVSVVARILAMSESESRKNIVAERLGVHHSVITRVLDEAETQRRSSLQAVS
ncbi:Protein of uncharacterised function (DUF2637) [Mycobacteroides abscessus subsp. abscessus]|uniref:hypothetical protein n=1 Tax=Mycobacteroides abscessus TaxID=36809 RepID=UPI0009A7079E|nr:hypothetical protein [Mycobacteroides abscessus]SLD05559.1 Protein of uncharacterised function (DUF2637) [Mycobacteroides abscessus subsp. abscessus]SLH59963.1 Protein of uncharacterised function (DUF2637) [Mycobacteroides abscessus subsp. abscessus]SLH80587.1 Protein of uncharacterised function (DUF2637) [Mycobacteroides abscessus subsp. abscessus]